MILLLGKSGYIGSSFEEELQRRGTKYLGVSRSEHDYTKPDQLQTLIGGWDIELVINCAAFITKPSVDLCENFKRESLLGNVVFPVMLSDICQYAQIPLMHISTGCLYRGDNGGKGFAETSPPMLTFSTGCRFYTGTKELAESVLSQRPSTYCVRIRLPFDNINHPRNFLTKLKAFDFIFDSINSLSHRGDFVKACLDLWNVRAPFGIYNVTNPGSYRTQEIAKLVRDRWVSVPSPGYDCVLDTSKLLNTGVQIRSVDEALGECEMKWVP